MLQFLARSTFLLALVVVLAVPALANNVFVGNKPFKGQVVGTGSEVRFNFFDLAKALKYEIVEGEDGWTMAGYALATFEESGVIWVNLEDIPKELVRVVRSTELNTLDLYRVATLDSGPVEDWAGADGKLVYFYADWSPACHTMAPTIDVIERSRTIKLIRLNIDKPATRVYKRYVHHFEGNYIPFFAVLDSRGKKITFFSGFQSYSDIISKLKKAFPE